MWAWIWFIAFVIVLSMYIDAKKKIEALEEQSSMYENVVEFDDVDENFTSIDFEKLNLEVIEQFHQAVGLVIEHGSASSSFLQQKLHTSYMNAARLLEMMEDRKIISPADGAKPRNILMTKKEYEGKTAWVNRGIDPWDLS